ncbi:helix-turn-helix transcriptional regulator [Acinetobacter rudis]|uniref:Helix-turn-helix transcriptional regulator n=1 Tax=Acinetobacter rudis TaxID=632955 RepID=A0AAW8J694_9GAMM|nr:helix-turn-helix transcriptional regulator [Acinetobacter rudis]MDQ8935626.1 helix-turn-helix transcriptional regulator [Acinetobacter rudis]MDQ9017889.1 helix-turn-helix transcriptional regulator [Acinetobacter rudis]
MKNIISELRAKQGWSQQQLAELLNVSRQTVNAIEKGRYDPSLPLAFKLSKVFNLSIEVIFQNESN